MRSRSGIAGADTMVAPGIDGDRDGAHSLQTIPETDCGGTAGEEEDVSVLLALFVCLCGFFAICHTVSNSIILAKYPCLPKINLTILDSGVAPFVVRLWLLSFASYCYKI